MTGAGELASDRYLYLVSICLRVSPLVGWGASLNHLEPSLVLPTSEQVFSVYVRGGKTYIFYIPVFLLCEMFNFCTVEKVPQLQCGPFSLHMLRVYLPTCLVY